MSPGSWMCSLSCRRTDALRKSLASVALRSSIGSRRRITPVEFEEIEGEQHSLGLDLAAIAQAIEYRDAILAADHNLAVE